MFAPFLSLRLVDVGAAARMFDVCASRRRLGCLMFVRRGGGLGNHGWKRLHEEGQHLNMAWVAILCR